MKIPSVVVERIVYRCGKIEGRKAHRNMWGIYGSPEGAEIKIAEVYVWPAAEPRVQFCTLLSPSNRTYVYVLAGEIMKNESGD